MRKKETLIESSIETSMESPIESPTESRPIEKRKISRTGTLTRARVLWCLAAAGCGLWNVYHAVMTERGTQNAGDQDILYPGHRGERHGLPIGGRADFWSDRSGSCERKDNGSRSTGKI
jgi:hypothetical protein